MAGILLGSAGHAQSRHRLVAQADSAFAAGDVALADSLYYIVVRQRPRDPEGRAALGRYLGAQGKAKVAVVLLEEARMFGGDPSTIARELAPLYEYLGEWRALLTLTGSPLSVAERRRAAWLSEHPFGVVSEGGAASIIGAPKGDTIARVAVRVSGRSAVAAIVASDIGIVVGSRVIGESGRRFDGDSTVSVLDSMTVGSVRLVNVPVGLGTAPGTVAIGAAALGRLVLQIDYKRSRIALVQSDAGAAETRSMLVRTGGQLRVLDRGRWTSLADYAAVVAKASKTLIVDVAGGEVRVRP